MKNFNPNNIICHQKGAELYNLKVVHYPNKTELRFYEAPIGIHHSVPPKRTLYIKHDGVQYNKETGERRTDESIYRTIKKSANRTKQSIYSYLLSNDWTGGWFFNITFDPDLVDSSNYDECYQKVHQLLKNMKAKNKGMKYLFVPDLHESGRWHFHGIAVNCKPNLSNEKKVKNRITRYQLDSRTFKYGFTEVSEIQDIGKVTNYIAVKITYELVEKTKGQNRYLYSKNLKKPEITTAYLDDEQIKRMKEQLDTNPNLERKNIYGNEAHKESVTYYQIKKEKPPLQ